MKLLEILIYIYFFISVGRWVLTFIQIQNHPFGRFATINVTIWDNILWIAPVVYFHGGLS